jgi:hypothetical protein
MSKNKEIITIGLFGTCGNSQWRESFIEEYNKLNIEWYNPVDPNWKPENAAIEAEHLKLDEIILFPVTDETYGLGSLSEVGFSILAAIEANKERFVIVYIAPKVCEALMENKLLSTESNKSRALVKAHLKEQSNNYPNVYIVDSLDKMKEISIYLYQAMVNLKEARKFCINRSENI